KHWYSADDCRIAVQQIIICKISKSSVIIQLADFNRVSFKLNIMLSYFKSGFHFMICKQLSNSISLYSQCLGFSELPVIICSARKEGCITDITCINLTRQVTGIS